MTIGSIITKNGKKVFLYRAYTENGSLSSTLYLPATKFKLGVDNATPQTADNDLTSPIPIANGTVPDNGSNTFTGSDGGDNSTDNTTTFKQGAGETDVTAQNLIANGTSVTKIWTIADLTAGGVNADATKYVGLNHYIKDAAALAKYLIAGTCLEFRLGADSTTNYYSKVYTAADLTVGWNWLNDGALLSTWTVNGTPGTLNDFQIRITTNNAADAFVAGDVIYDLLRQWTSADLIKDFVVDFPTIDFDLLEVTTRTYITTLEANGFLLSGLGFFSEDTAPLMTSEDTFDEDSKSDTDEFAFVVVDRVI